MQAGDLCVVTAFHWGISAYEQEVLLLDCLNLLTPWPLAMDPLLPLDPHPFNQMPPPPPPVDHYLNDQQRICAYSSCPYNSCRNGKTMIKFTQLHVVSFMMLLGKVHKYLTGWLLGYQAGIPRIAWSLWAFKCSVPTTACQVLVLIFAQVELATTLVPDRAVILGL